MHGGEDKMEQKIQEKSDIDNGGIGLIYGISDFSIYLLHLEE